MLFEHKVMRLKDFEKARFQPGAMCPKLDGIRAYYYPGESTLISRQEKPIYGMEHIIYELSDMEYPLDLELTVPGLEFNKASGIIRNHSVTPEVVANVIDVVKPGDLHFRLCFRPDETDHIKHIPHYRCGSFGQWGTFYLKCLREGYEGAVWKSIGATYRHTRSFDWMRLVPIKSEDCVVLDVYEGKGKMEGIAGGILINFRGIECKCGTMKGLDYNDREDLLKYKEDFIGVIAQVEYKNLQPSGKPRQPRFKRWRYDKS